MRKINKFLCLLFFAVFVLCMLASFLLDGIYLTYASIAGVFALGFGVLWFVWSKKEKSQQPMTEVTGLCGPPHKPGTKAMRC